MRPWVLKLAVDRGFYRVDLRAKTYTYVGRNPAWKRLSPGENARNKRQLHGLVRVFRDGSTKRFVDRTWSYTEKKPCPTCYSWVPRDSPCDHDKYECPTCGRRQCLLHWRYPMQTQREAIHFLKAAEITMGKSCFVKPVVKRRQTHSATVWKIFTSRDDYRTYLDTNTHARESGSAPRSPGDSRRGFRAQRRLPTMERVCSRHGAATLNPPVPPRS